MKSARRTAVALVCAIGIFSLIGCSDDVKDLINGGVEQAVEAGIDDALTDTVVPVSSFIEAISSLLAAPAPNPARGAACPDTSGWCAGGGTAACSVGPNGYDFDFNACVGLAGDLSLTVDGDVTATPGTTIFLTFSNFFINNSSAINGSGTITQSTCSYTINLQSDGATIAGTIIQCENVDEYPTGNVVNIGFGDFLVVVTLNGTANVPADAMRNGSLVAECTINLDSLTSTCNVP